ncbi:MAG: hypothetical protein J7621_23125 [Niastella sp.]|nr:hypothetical protein [Niastella sp.]
MKEKILKEVEELTKKAKAIGKPDFKISVKSEETSSLGKIITTKEQGEFFMKMLKALQ